MPQKHGAHGRFVGGGGSSGGGSGGMSSGAGKAVKAPGPVKGTKVGSPLKVGVGKTAVSNGISGAMVSHFPKDATPRRSGGRAQARAQAIEALDAKKGGRTKGPGGTQLSYAAAKTRQRANGNAFLPGAAAEHKASRPKPVAGKKIKG